MSARQLVVIEWLDAVSLGDDIYRSDPKVLGALARPARVSTVGWMLLDTTEGYLIASEYHDYDDGEDVRNVSFIPRGMVTGVERIGRNT